MKDTHTVARRLALVATAVVASGLLSGYAVSSHSPATSALVAPAPASGKHMLFRVRGATGATVYLLGSVHLLDPQAGKLPPEVDSAFAHAKSVTFETSLDSMQMRGMEMMSRGQFTGGATLRSSLSPAGVAKADSVLKLYGLTIDQVNQFKPWLVSVLMTQMVIRKAKFEAQYGVDIQLNDRAKQANKPVMGLESVDFQMGIFDRVSAADQERMLTMSSSPDSAARMLSQIKDAWLAGDAGMLDSLLNRASGESPAFVSMLVTERNRNWIPKIENLLKGKDDALVVVGAAHLVGSQGVVALLKAKGYSIEQM
jgi:uncharacterized protein YbaP (TraB family)